MKKNNFAKDANAWLDFALYDLKTAKWEYEGKIYTSCCYACQQVAEKALRDVFKARCTICYTISRKDSLLCPKQTVVSPEVPEWNTLQEYLFKVYTTMQKVLVLFVVD